MIQLTQVHATDIEFLKFIERIYTESFPPDERRDFSDVIRLLEENDDFFIVYLMKTKQSDLSLIGNGMTFPMSNTSP